MDMQDNKIALFNLMTFTVSFTSVEQWLKVILLIASIAYTVLKIYEIKKKKDEE
jgi:hypothetical protein